MKNVLKGILTLAIVFGFASCSDDDDGTNNQHETARMSVKLVDAPGDYDAVYIDVRDLVVKYEGSETEASIGQVNAGIYDLLELTGGVSALLVDDELTTGKISQMRLVLGADNSVVIDGETYPLATPSSQQSGLKLQLNETLEADVFYEFVLDFDVDESIVDQGNGGYTLKPVIRASLVADVGKIAGQVMPSGVQTLVTANSGGAEISSYVDSQGNYVLYGVPEGTATLTFEADPVLGLPPITIPDVEVVAGLTTEMDVVVFE